MSFVYKRVLIKISGEALAGDKKTGFDFDFISKVCQTIKTCVEEGVEMAELLAGKDDCIIAFGSLSFMGRLMEIVQKTMETGKTAGDNKRRKRN